jgi:hypothetical protein
MGRTESNAYPSDSLSKKGIAEDSDFKPSGFLAAFPEAFQILIVS